MSTPISPPGKPATLHDVAREAGVSLITASRALSNPTLVSDKTIERVQQAVTATGYIPNLPARRLEAQRPPRVAGPVPPRPGPPAPGPGADPGSRRRTER